ncbi:MAG: acyl carrier protein [Eggerthellaceae bacterium]|nr:acyl carrier protein [Eggerthellaceae bacterium]
MDKVMEILKGVRPDVDFENEKLLIDANVLDSFDIIAIVGELVDTFDVSIDVADLEPENFNSAEAIWELVQSLQ